jgi:hypothetical protein
MKFSDQFYNISLALLAASLLGLYLNNLFIVGDANNYFIIFGLSCALLSYKFSNGYKLKNSVENLIKKLGGNIEISSVKLLPFNFRVKTIEIKRISKVTIGKNWLSIIIDGNGNGYDFQLLASESKIDEHIKALLALQETSNIDFQYI